MAALLAGIGSGLTGTAAAGGLASGIGNFLGSSMMAGTGGQGLMQQLIPNAGTNQTGQAANQQQAQAPQSMSSQNTNQYTPPDYTQTLIQNLLKNPYGA